MRKQFDMEKICKAASLIKEDDDLIHFVKGKWVCDDNAPEEVKEFVRFKNWQVEESKRALKIHLRVFADANKE